MSDEIARAQVEAYLDGALDPQETEAFERALSQPEVALSLSHAIALRTALRELPDSEPPAWLCGQLEALVVGELRRAAAEQGRSAPGLLEPARWWQWAPRGGVAAGTIGVGQGLRTMRWVLGPWAMRERPAPVEAGPGRGRALGQALARRLVRQWRAR